MSVLNYITWDVSPFIYEGDHFAIGWYGTLWTLGLIGMLVTLLITFKHDGVPTQYALITFLLALLFVVYGAHLFQGLFYEWFYVPDLPWNFLGIDWDYRNYYFDHLWKFIDISRGGFASHGTVLGLILLGYFLSKPFKCNMWYIIDRGMIGLSFIGASVRLGNLFNSEIYGIETNLPWGFLFNESSTASHPTQIYEMLIFLIPMICAWGIFFLKDGGSYKGLISGFLMLSVMSLRFMVEFIKLPQMQIEKNWILNMGQWLSIPYILFGGYMIYYALKNGKQTDMTPQPEISQRKRKKK